jgi:hypothetical protein
MTFRRTPPPPQSEPSSVALLRAIGELQLLEEGEPITDLDALALMAGLVYVEIPALIEIGIVKGFIEDGEAGEVALTAKGWRWWERDPERRGYRSGGMGAATGGGEQGEGLEPAAMPEVGRGGGAGARGRVRRRSARRARGAGKRDE